MSKDKGKTPKTYITKVDKTTKGVVKGGAQIPRSTKPPSPPPKK